jgi:hypothetical protein
VSSNIEEANIPSSGQFEDEIDALFASKTDEANSSDLIDGRDDKAESLTPERSTDSVPNAKKPISKNRLGLMILAGGGLLMGFMLYLNSPSEPDRASPSQGAGSGFKESEESKGFGGLSPEAVHELQSEVSSAKNEIAQMKSSTLKAFELISQQLTDVNLKMDSIEKQNLEGSENYKMLVDSGNNKFVDQSQKIKSVEQRLNVEMKKLTDKLNQVGSFVQDQKEKMVIAKRKTYEAISVVQGRALLRDVATNEEYRISEGSELVGFGRIASINITGCITLDSGERITPINARCL